MAIGYAAGAGVTMARGPRRRCVIARRRHRTAGSALGRKGNRTSAGGVFGEGRATSLIGAGTVHQLRLAQKLGISLQGLGSFALRTGRNGESGRCGSVPQACGAPRAESAGASGPSIAVELGDDAGSTRTMDLAQALARRFEQWEWARFTQFWPDTALTRDQRADVFIGGSRGASKWKVRPVMEVF